MTPLTKQLEDKKKELIILNECCSQDKNSIEGILKAEIAILEQAIAEIENIQSQQNPSQASEGVKIEASHNQHRTPKVVNVEEIQRDVNLTSTNLSADISNLLQKQRQEISDLIDKFQIELYQEMKHDSNLLFTSLKAFIKNPKLFEQLNQPKEEQ